MERCSLSAVMARFLGLWILGGSLACWNAVLAEPTYVDDTTRALSPAAQVELERELAAFHSETGVRLTVKAIAYLESSLTMRTAAREARLAFSPTGPVAIIMIDRGKNGLGISHSPELWQRYPLADMVEVLRGALLEASNREQEIEAKLLATSRKWMAEIRKLEANRKQALPVVQSREVPLVLGFVTLLALVGLGGRYFGAKARERLIQQNQRYPLPEVVVGQRLGAPFGGGHMVLSEPAGQGR